MTNETKICKYCGKELLAEAEICWNCNNYQDIENNIQTATCHENHTYKLTIKIAKVPFVIFSDVTIKVDGKEFQLKNGEALQLEVIRGRHKITCKSTTPIKELKNEILVTIENDSTVGIKFDRMNGELKIQEGEFKNDNLLCIIGFFIALSYFFTILLPILGLIIAIIGLYQVGKTKEHGKGLAIIGIILGIVAIITEILLFFYF